MTPIRDFVHKASTVGRAVCLLVGVVPFLTKRTSEKPNESLKTSFSKFGCPYINEYYELGNSTKDSEAVWSNKVEPFFIADLDELNTLMDTLRDNMKEFYKRTLFNSFDDFIEFHDKYKQYMSKLPSGTVKSFYAQYKPEIFKSPYTFGYQGISLMEQLSTTNTLSWMYPEISKTISPLSWLFPNLSKSMYAVSIESQVPYNILDALENKNAPPRDRKQYLYMVCIRISLSERLGYVLMGPHLNLRNPIIVMDDGGEPRTGEVQYERKRVEFMSFWKNKDYIYAHSTGENILPMLIYARYPYCSERDFTQKPSLVVPSRTITRMDAMGNTEAAVFFNAEAIMKGNVHGREINQAAFSVFVQDSKIPQPKIYRIPFEKISEEENGSQTLTDEETNIINAANKALKLQKGDLMKKLKRVAILMQDTKFLRDIKTIHETIKSTNMALISTSIEKTT